MVATVVSLAVERAKRALNRAASLAPDHPMLRWVGEDGLSHVRADNDVSRCGKAVLGGPALPSALRCQECEQ